MDSNLELRVKQLEAKVQELSDREAIRELRYRYHQCINEGTNADNPSLFTADGEIDFGHLGRAKGKPELMAWFTKLMARPSSKGDSPSHVYSFVKQFIHNHMIQLHGDTGEGISYLFATPVHKGESYVIACRYNDVYAREGGVWKFKKMALTTFYMVPLREGWAQQDRVKMGFTS
jgi:hypothetical protein